ncbi:MAG: hypothetical protein JWQ24_2781 [Tardiphaga sp.]|nr:hypothetical protein [Tardiphaga sp.]
MSAPLSQSEPRGRCSIEPRRFNGANKWLPILDGVPAEGRDHEDACLDFPDDAIAVACRLSRMHGRAM